MIPALDSSGVITPGQLGPIRRAWGAWVLRNCLALAISRTGIPSVMQIMREIPAFPASMTESAAAGAGTKIKETLASVFLTASSTVLKTGLSKWVVPPLPGVTPPTI